MPRSVTDHFASLPFALCVCAVVAVVAGLTIPCAARADEADRAIERAEAAYRAGDFPGAALELSYVPGLLGVVPELDEIRGSRRARILFDLGRCYLAAGDEASAEEVFAYLHRISPGERRGVFSLPRDAAYEGSRERVVSLEIETRQILIASRSRWSAALRSVVMPGWGQIYRGHRGKGKGMIAATGALLVAWRLADRAYNNAVNQYERTTVVDLGLLTRTGASTDPKPFSTRFSRAKSRARIANITVAALAGLWIYSVGENLFIGPGRVGVTVPID